MCPEWRLCNSFSTPHFHIIWPRSEATSQSSSRHFLECLHLHTVLQHVIVYCYENVQYIKINVNILQGVPKLSSHFVLLVFSASHAHTEVHITIFQQARRGRLQNSPYFPLYFKNLSSYRAKRGATLI